MSISIRSIQSKVHYKIVLRMVHFATSVGCVLYRLVTWIYLGKPRETKATSVTCQKPTEQNCQYVTNMRA